MKFNPTKKKISLYVLSCAAMLAGGLFVVNSLQNNSTNNDYEVKEGTDSLGFLAKELRLAPEAQSAGLAGQFAGSIRLGDNAGMRFTYELPVASFVEDGKTAADYSYGILVAKQSSLDTVNGSKVNLSSLVDTLFTDTTVVSVPYTNGDKTANIFNVVANNKVVDDTNVTFAAVLTGDYTDVLFHDDFTAVAYVSDGTTITFSSDSSTSYAALTRRYLDGAAGELDPADQTALEGIYGSFTHKASDDWTVQSVADGKATLVKTCTSGNEVLDSKVVDAPADYTLKIDSFDAFANVATVKKGTHTFDYNSDGNLVSNNKGVDNSSATLEATVNDDFLLSFNYELSSEKKYDTFSIQIMDANGSSRKNIKYQISGTYSSTAITNEPIYKGETFKLTYSKDSSGAGGSQDIATISNLSFNKAVGVGTKISTINYETNGGDAIASQTVFSGLPFEMPEASKEGMAFGGWYLDSALTLPAGNGFVTNGDVTLYAKYNQPAVLTINSNNGTEVEVITYSVDEIVTIPDPTYTKHIFAGWYTTPTFDDGTAWTSGNAITVDTTIYAKWEAAPAYVGTFNGNELESGNTFRTFARTLSIDEAGNITGNTRTGTVTSYDSETGILKYKTSSGEEYTMYYFADAEVLVAPYSQSSTDIGKDDYVFVPEGYTLTTSASGFKVNDSSSYNARLFEVTKEGVAHKYLIMNNTIYEDVEISSLFNTSLSLSNAYNSSDVVIKDSLGNVLLAQGYNGSQMVDLDAAYGLYTNETNASATLKVDGLGKLEISAGNNSTAGTYTIMDDGRLAAYVSAFYYEITLTDTQYSLVKPMVTISYVTGEGHDAIADEEHNINVVATLADGTDEGYVFNGWYFDDAFTSAVPADFKPTEDVTLYAKYSAPAVVTVYENNGTTAYPVTYSVGETTDVVNPSYAKHVFVGWYTTADFQTGTEWNNSEITEDVTIYAKWEDAPAYCNTYSFGYYSSLTASFYTYSTYDATITESGKVDMDAPKSWPFNNANSQISESEREGELVYYSGSSYYRLFLDESTGIMVMNRDSGKDAEMQGKVTFLTPFESDVTTANISSSAWKNSDNSYVRLFTYTYDGTDYTFALVNDTIHFGASFKDASGNPVVAANASKAEAVYVYDKNDALLGKFGYENSKMHVLNGTEGTYTGANGDMVLNGVSTIKVGEATGTYTVVADKDYDLTAMINGVYYEVTLGEGTYTMVSPTVVVTYDAGDKATVDAYTALKNTEYTLPTPENADYVFAGWYLDAEYTEALGAKYTPTADVVLYAKWNLKIEITLVNNNGTENGTVDAEATVVPTLGNDPVYNGHIFLGWYTDEACTTKYDGSAFDASTTLYAKWMETPAYVGNYNGGNYDGTPKVDYSYTIDEEFNIKKGTDLKGTIDPESYNANEHSYEYIKNGSRYKIYFYETTNHKFLLIGYSNTQTPICSDFMVLVKNSTTPTAATQFNWNSNKEMIGSLVVDGTTIFFYTNSETQEFIGEISLFDAQGNVLTNEDLSTTSSLILKNSDDSVAKEFIKNGSDFVALDGNQGEYTGDLGKVVLDGGSTAIVADATGTYKVIDGKVEVTYGNITKTITLGEGMYTVVTDGTEGTYTGNNGDFVSNGDGTATLNGVAATYTKNGDTLVVFVGESESTIKLSGTAYLTNSIFANHTFTGTYYDEWYEIDSSLKFVFADGTDISGTIYAGAGTTYYFHFTGEFDADTNTLTLTITSAIDSGAPGKVVVCNVTGNTLTVVSNGITNSSYSFDNNGSATSDTFSL